MKNLVLVSLALLTKAVVAQRTDPLVKMADYIVDELEGKVTGFSYAIAHRGKVARSGGGGIARTDSDYRGDGSLAFDEDITVPIASVSKTVTAVATLKLLETLGLSIFSKIYPWLPPEWDRAPGIDDLTFKDLLTHRTSWKQRFDILKAHGQHGPWGNGWDGLEFIISSVGAVSGYDYGYKNANYAILRVIVPALMKASGAPYNTMGPINEDTYTFDFTRYLQQEIFEPAGVYDAGCWDSKGSLTAYAYNFNQPDNAGYRPPNKFAGCGGHSGLRLTAVELVRFMAGITHDDDIFSPENRALMDLFLLGWKYNSYGGSFPGKFFHNGDLYHGQGREYHSCVMKYPNDIEAVLLINSTKSRGLCAVLRDAYDEAF